MRPQDFYTRTRASTGVRIEFADPAGNREWIRVRSVMSAEFKRASEAIVLQAVADGRLSADQPSLRKHHARQRRAALAAALIAEWSLPSDIDPVALLASAPRLRRQIELIAENHALHFGVAE